MRTKLAADRGSRAFVLALVAMLLVGGWLLTRPGTYLAQANVMLFTSNGGANAMDGSSDRLTGLAGITAKSVTGNLGAPNLASNDVSLAAQGKLGWSVSQRNEGGQWTYWFPSPMLDVQVAGRSEEEVRTGMTDVVARIRSDISARENAAGVFQSNQIQTMLIPPVAQFSYNDGDRARASAALLALTLLVACSAGHLARRFPSRSRR